MRRLRRGRPAAAVAAGIWIVAVGCGDEAARTVEREVRGDTSIVRTIERGGSALAGELVEELRIGALAGADHLTFGRVASLAVAADGSIYAMDSQVPALRKYAPDGTYIATFGREGGGPGEYSAPDGGLVVLPDGRVVLRDPGNGRFQVYSAEGEPLATWPLRSGVQTSHPLVADTSGNIYSMVSVGGPDGDRRTGMLAYDSATGEPGDTVLVPSRDHRPPFLVAERRTPRGPARSEVYVPFGARTSWAFSPLGYMVGGVGTRYAIDQFLPDGSVLRIERVRDPVRVEPAERAEAEEIVSRRMRNLEPGWSWDGPPIPGVKPHFTGIFVGLEGRIWVLIPQPGERIPEEELEPTEPGAPPSPRWRERIAFDVFEPDGTYVGTARAPWGLSLFPRPVFRGDRVWAVARDELDVPYVTRLRLRLP